MAIETKKKEIGGISFEVTQLPYFRAQRLFFRLLKLAGPGLLGLLQLAGVTSGASVVAALGQKDVKDLAPLLGAFFERLEPAEMEDLTQKILDGARASLNGKMVSLVDAMDLVIGGDFWTGLAVQAFALSVHFGNFSSARGALQSLGLNLNGAPPSEASTTSTA